MVDENSFAAAILVSEWQKVSDTVDELDRRYGRVITFNEDLQDGVAGEAVN